MAQQVIKRDGSKEPFDAEKIKKAVETAGGEAGLSPERLSEVVTQVLEVVMQFAADKEEVSSSELREKALGKLEEIEPLVAGVWRKYDQEQGRV